MFSFSIHFLLYFHSPEIFLGNVTIPLIRTVQGVALYFEGSRDNKPHCSNPLEKDEDYICTDKGFCSYIF